MTFFISNAYAQSAGEPAPQGSGYSLVIMLVVFVLLIYFTIWRPQNRRAKEQQSVLNSLAKGDEVMTAGGVLGRISKITDQYIVLSVGNNVEMMLQKSAVVSVLPKGTIKSLE
ncbi:MAG: preprotein translocase subunit YajC [Gammaproteobacteria bacterium]|nr:preprotein translocase subunit YajC [Gammaproteobacteria bacterium]